MTSTTLSALGIDEKVERKLIDEMGRAITTAVDSVGKQQTERKLKLTAFMLAPIAVQHTLAMMLASLAHDQNGSSFKEGEERVTLDKLLDSATGDIRNAAKIMYAALEVAKKDAPQFFDVIVGEEKGNPHAE
jgi:hypothetical protein